MKQHNVTIKETGNGTKEFKEVSKRIREVIHDYPEYGYILFHKDDKIIDLFKCKLINR